MSKEPRTREEIEKAVDSWISNLLGWKRRFIEGLRNEILDLRERLSIAHTKVRAYEDANTVKELKILREFVKHQDWLLIAYRTQRPPSDATLDGIRRCRAQLEALRSMSHDHT